MKKKQNNKSWGWSHSLTVLMIIMAMATIIYSMLLMWKTNDTSALAFLIPSVFGTVGTCLSFYLWKSKAENIEKIKRERIKDGIEHKDLQKPEDIYIDSVG